LLIWLWFLLARDSVHLKEWEQRVIGWGGLFLFALFGLAGFFNVSSSNIGKYITPLFPDPLTIQYLSLVSSFIGALMFLSGSKRFSTFGKSPERSYRNFIAEVLIMGSAGAIMIWSAVGVIWYVLAVNAPLQFEVGRVFLYLVGGVLLAYATLNSTGEVRNRLTTKPPSTSPQSQDLFSKLPQLTRTVDLITGLDAIIMNQPSIPFRDRAAKYSILFAKAQPILGDEIDREKFYINPDRLKESEENSAHITERATELLRMVEAYRAKVLNP
jgi:hypothetical protein